MPTTEKVESVAGAGAETSSGEVGEKTAVEGGETEDKKKLDRKTSKSGREEDLEEGEHKSKYAQSQLVFGSRKKFSTTYAIVTFFSPDLPMKMSNFSKSVHTISIEFCTVIIHPKVLLRAQLFQNFITGI